MIIDCHMHLRGGGPERPVYPAEQVLRVMDGAGIDRAVVLAICEDSQSANRRVREAVHAHPDRFIGFAYALPSLVADVAAETHRAVEEDGFRGIKIHFAETYPAPHVLWPFFAAIGELGVPALIDSAGRVEALLELNEHFPRQVLIAAHLGNAGAAGARRLAERALKSESLYLDTSWVRDTHLIRECLAVAGPRKLLFGTDGPEIPAEVELYKIRCLKLPPAEEALILGGNIARLVGLAAGGA